MTTNVYSILNVVVESNQMDQIKDQFRGKISLRRLSCVNSIAGIINLLVKQGLITSETRDIINEHVDKYDDRQLITDCLNRIKKETSAINTNVYASTRRAEEERSQSLYNINIPRRRTSNMDFSQLYMEHQANIHIEISKQIGRKWRNFGRFLGCTEGELDTFEEMHNSIETRTHKIFASFEQVTHEREYYTKLCKALDDCGRKDLTNRIHYIMSG